MVMKSQEIVLKVENVSKAFSGIHAVAGVTLEIPAGQRRGIIGPNGAGKTTLFNLITGTLPLDLGSITLFKQNVTRYSVQRRANLGLSRSYQITNLFLNLTVEENLVLAANPHKIPPALIPWRRQNNVRNWVAEVAAQTGLTNKIDASVKELSHGEQRQLELGMCLAARPQLIMMDEPAAGLSPTERHHIMTLIRKLDSNITILLIEHDMTVLMGLAEVVTVMNQGQVIAEGTPDFIRQNSLVQDVYMGTLEI